MTNMSIQPLWLTHFTKIILVLEFQLTKFIVGSLSYKAHSRPQISSNGSGAFHVDVEHKLWSIRSLVIVSLGVSYKYNLVF